MTKRRHQIVTNIDQELDDFRSAGSHVSEPAVGSFSNAVNGTPDTVSIDNPIKEGQVAPSPKASSCVHCSNVPSHILHIDDSLDSQTFEPSVRTFARKGRNVHGICHLPNGFALAPVAITAVVAELDPVQNRE